jgi:hypothetical protein
VAFVLENSGARIKRIMTSRISGRSFQTRYRFFFELLLVKQLLGIFEKSVGNSLRNRVPRRISVANPTWLK